jgi:hypothetical protein
MALAIDASLMSRRYVMVLELRWIGRTQKIGKDG